MDLESASTPVSVTVSASVSQSEIIDCQCKSVKELVATCAMGPSQCCWCTDKRVKRTIYVDNYGVIEPSQYGYPMPRDLHYCIICKHPDTVSVGVFMEELKKALPDAGVLLGQQTRQNKQIKKTIAARIRKCEGAERERKEAAIKKFNSRN